VSDGRLTGLEIYPKFPLVVRGACVDTFEATLINTVGLEVA